MALIFVGKEMERICIRFISFPWPESVFKPPPNSKAGERGRGKGEKRERRYSQVHNTLIYCVFSGYFV
jgi:hypothetical protein